MYWHAQPCPSLPVVPFDVVPPSPKTASFPACIDGQQLIAFVDAAHGTDINAFRSVSGISCMMGGAAVVFKSKTQSIAAASSSEAEFICAVPTGKNKENNCKMLTNSILAVHCIIDNCI
jgi:hypothetical protein